ncbi:MAG: hypothetical protein JXR88_00610 [Clostridia bacterium]|nr:hypothetical protein [Clostridia bacterium]
MGKNKHNPMWAEAKIKCRINAATVQMAKEMGLSPKSLIKNIPSKNEQWKAPVQIWIQEMFEKKFGEAKLKEVIQKYKNVPHQS